MRSNQSKRITSTGILNELAGRNVRKSAKDYFIYFFTLTLSVCLFYSFNSVSTQFASLGLEDKLNYLAFSSSVLSAFSVLVCFIMGMLVVYANRFLLRRRKKEMGVYATLGMERRDLNRILMKETMRIGVFSLLAGLVLGIFAAQILSLITAKLTGLRVSSYRFMISGKAILFSIVFFGILFFFVHLFNVKEIKKMTLLDMLYADRKNETIPEGSRAAAVLITLLSVLLMLGGYAVIFLIAEKGIFRAVGIGGVLLIAGTLLFFSSVFKMMAGMMKQNKRSYFSGLNMFTASQFSSRFKTEGRSCAIIAVLLFLSLSLTMLGPGSGKYVMNGIEYANPYDGTIFYAPYDGKKEQEDPMARIESSEFSLGRFSDHYEAFWTYTAPSVTTGFLEENQEFSEGKRGELFLGSKSDTPLSIIGADDYNRILALQNQEAISLGGQEFAISYAFPPIEKHLQAFENHPKILQLGSAELTLAKQGIYRHAWENKNALIEQGTIIVPQKLTEGLLPDRWILNFNFAGDKKKAHEELYDNWFSSSPEGFQLQAGQEAIISITADNLLTTYLGIYLGITFLITSGAVLAIQQLAQSSDNARRYELLRKLGASKKDMKRSLTKQLRVYFGLPMFVAVMHSAVVVALVFRFFDGLARSVIFSIIGFSALMIFAVYAVYFIATYIGSRRILRL